MHIGRADPSGEHGRPNVSEKSVWKSFWAIGGLVSVFLVELGEFDGEVDSRADSGVGRGGGDVIFEGVAIFCCIVEGAG